MNLICLDLPFGSDEPPTEFRIFTAGKVVTSKGEFIFDAKAAKSVMAAFADQGNELMVDYDHASLSPMPVDPARAGIAAGWFGLELRDGELWAVNVRWTPPAIEALKRKEWRYMSPAFRTDGKRIAALINVALTNIPATKRLEPLMAASAVTEKRMDLTKVLAALGLSADASEEDVLKKLAERSAPAKAAPAPAPAATPMLESDRAAFEVIAREAHHEARMQGEIASLREQQRVSSVREILRSTDRYTTPAFESFAMTKTADEVREMLRAFPPKPQRLSEPRNAKKGVELTAADRRVGHLLGMDLKALAEHKAALADRDASRERARSEAFAAELEEV